MPDDVKPDLMKLVESLTDAEAKKAWEKLNDISTPHQLARMLLAGAASFLVGKTVEGLYTTYVKNHK